ncbi:acetyl-CoA carboxylase carboxyl transferase subunit beta [Peptoniphilus asaccharolyticus DSM 20463]|uniref:Acetyl-coenzyme A carboxylase carboxyl transferase subunit beta n=1 Tax=Peptoniphilus asaccharolyticus DSM 20463 TaxID=573058 RepID=A0A1W1UXH7_PEPAS|nr:acetyl-CoA carboxylase carboxyltransferase subunit beta [Peptoniphilus asaccharolyticus]MBL7575311.1 acetyl-CoA carboxylase carboxyl transferase subunit beta [Peptoniphilus asaccharolyticus]SMB85782.1 acetyl-CoA carboxylase carboxyl transferase subunit beta [Peptoniphilus asaccharolyticus DSM 20463]
MGSLSKRKNLLDIVRKVRIPHSKNKISKDIPDLFKACKKCKKAVEIEKLKENLYVCPNCGEHMKIRGIERFNYLFEDDYTNLNFNSKILDPISFLDYNELRDEQKKKTGLEEAISIAKGKIGDIETVVAVLEQDYLMGSLGTYVGEEITSMFEYAIEEKLPVIIFSSSGGARMQEGIFSLMQMAKTAAVINEFSKHGLLYISILTHPTMGGVSASFAGLGDIIIGEPKALIGFAGPRVIEQTVRQKLPEGFQRAEKLEECGFIDFICSRNKQREELYKILKLHQKTGARYECI